MKVDIIPVDVNTYQIRTKSASVLIEFENSIENEIFKGVVDICKSSEIASVSELKDMLTRLNKFSVEEVNLFFNQFSEHNLFDAIIEDNGLSDNSLNAIVSKKIIVIGDSRLSDEIYCELVGQSFRDIHKYTFEKIIKNRSVLQNADFLLVDCMCFNPYGLRVVNEFSIKSNIPWLHIGGVENEKIKLGPIFHGKESGCYECLEKRRISNIDNPAYELGYIDFLMESKLSSRPDTIPYQDFYLNLIVNLSIIEMCRFFEDKNLLPTWRGIISFDLYKYTTTRSELLRNPYCPVCRPLQRTPFSPWLDKGNTKSE